MKNGTVELGIAERFAAGSLAGVFSQTAIYPLEVRYLITFFVNHCGRCVWLGSGVVRYGAGLAVNRSWVL